MDVWYNPQWCMLCSGIQQGTGFPVFSFLFLSVKTVYRKPNKHPKNPSLKVTSPGLDKSKRMREKVIFIFLCKGLMWFQAIPSHCRNGLWNSKLGVICKNQPAFFSTLESQDESNKWLAKRRSNCGCGCSTLSTLDVNCKSSLWQQVSDPALTEVHGRAAIDLRRY